MSELNNDDDVTIKPQRLENLPLATVSLVFGILSFIMIPFCGLVSLITGIIALGKINSSKGVLQGKGKAIAGIVLGVWSIVRLSVLAIILAAILLPALSAARYRAREVFCMTNLKKIATNAFQFAEEHNDTFPASMEELMDYMKKSDSNFTKDLHCPLDAKSKYDFIPSAKGIELSKLENPATTPVVVCKNHPNTEIILYADGHVETKKTKVE